MLIELQPPFKDRWKKGYLQIHRNGRKNVYLYNSDQDRTTISYARYLMSVHIGMEIPSEYEVDHKDDDKTNDVIENLQILTKEQNRLKQEYKYIFFEQAHYHVQCAYCGFQYLISERDLKMKLAKNLTYIFCSRRCAVGFQFNKTSINFISSYN